MDASTLVTTKTLAQRSAALVGTLQLGAIQEGTGIYLIGALDIAMGNFDDALSGFTTSLQWHQAAPAPGFALLVRGYEVIAEGLRARHSREDINGDLEKVYAQITSGGFKDEA